MEMAKIAELLQRREEIDAQVNHLEYQKQQHYEKRAEINKEIAALMGVEKPKGRPRKK